MAVPVAQPKKPLKPPIASASGGMFNADLPPPADPNSDMIAIGAPGPTPPMGQIQGPGLQPEPSAAPAPASNRIPQQGTSPFPGGVWVGQHGIGWVPPDHPAASLAQPAAPTTPTPTAPPPGAPAPAPAAPPAPGQPAPPPATVNDAYKNALMNLLTQSQQPASLNDPALKGQADAFSVGQTRAKERAREAMAERAASQGQLSDQASGGDFNQGLLGLEQQQGEAESAFGAGLVGQEAVRRRDELMQAAALAGNQLNAEEARALQRELATLDAQIRREGLSLQGALGNRGLDVQRELGRGQLDLGGRELGLRGELGRGQLNLGLLAQILGNQQFGQGLGANLGMFNANMNRQSLLDLLGGL